MGVDQIIQAMRPKLAEVTGMRVYLQNPPPIRIGGQFTRSLYQFTLQSPNSDELYRYTPMLEGKLRAMPGLQDVTSDLEIKNPQVDIRHRSGQSIQSWSIGAANRRRPLLCIWIRQVSTIYAPTNQYQVIMELQDQYQKDPAALSMLYVRSSSGELVPLSAIAKITPSMGPLSVNHAGQLLP